MTEAEIKRYIDTEAALARIRGNNKLFKTLLKHFLATRSQFDQLKGEVAAGDREAAAKSVHAIKGISANLSMTVLYEQSPILEALVKSGADIAEAFAAYEAAYEKTMESVNCLWETLPE